MSPRARPSRRWLRGVLAAAAFTLLPVHAADAAARYEEIDLPSAQGNVDLSYVKLNRVTSLMATVRLPDGYDEQPGKRWPCSTSSRASETTAAPGRSAAPATSRRSPATSPRSS